MSLNLTEKKDRRDLDDYLEEGGEDAEGIIIKGEDLD